MLRLLTPLMTVIAPVHSSPYPCPSSHSIVIATARAASELAGATSTS